MAAKREIPDADHLVNLYLSGAAMRQLLKKRNISSCLFNRLLRDHGVKPRSLQDAGIVRRGRPVEVLRWRPDDPEALVDRYTGGESLKKISDDLNISRQAIGDWLKRQGVALRGRSQSEALKWATIKQDRGLVERQCQAAWEATHQRAITHLDDELVQRFHAEQSTKEIAQALGVSRPFVKKRLVALGLVLTEFAKERRAHGVQCFIPRTDSQMISPLELDVLTELAGLGRPGIHQYAIGTSNVDIAFERDRVAVEIERRSGNSSKSLRRERLEYLFGAGWRLLVVYHPRRSCRLPTGERTDGPFHARQVAQQIISFLDLMSADPPTTGQYGMIRGDGKRNTRRCMNLDDFSRVSGF